MLWRVRTTMPDRPGALARLAHSCGERGANILALQIFPGVDGVTDELVLSVPRHWEARDVADLVARAGGAAVSVGSCTEQALVDGPTLFLDAVRRVAHAPEDVGRVLARLLDAEPVGAGDRVAATAGPDVLVVRCGERSVAVRRTTPFTATEHARAHAFAAAVTELALAVDAASGLEPVPTGERSDVLLRVARADDAGGVAALHARSSAETVRRAHGTPLARVDARLARRLLVGGSGALVAVEDERVRGLASLGEVVDGACLLTLLVEDSWHRRGLGTRLLAGATSLAAAAGAAELVLRGPAQSPAAVALAFGSGLRARMRLVGDELEVRVGTRGAGAFRAVPVASAPAPA
ncbi:MAG TPA: GNAT family N-acetyltransferase [Nocardioides sp.]|nr:GNAT family N-acetyltransferase [Nocardioides sp.]